MGTTPQKLSQTLNSLLSSTKWMVARVQPMVHDPYMTLMHYYVSLIPPYALNRWHTGMALITRCNSSSSTPSTGCSQVSTTEQVAHLNRWHTGTHMVLTTRTPYMPLICPLLAFRYPYVPLTHPYVPFMHLLHVSYMPLHAPYMPFTPPYVPLTHPLHAS